MVSPISGEVKQQVKRLYDSGLSIRKIAEQVGVSLSYVYKQTRVLERRNPETGKPFVSQEEYDNFLIRHRKRKIGGGVYSSASEYIKISSLTQINPETGERFEDYRDIRSYRARKKINPLTGQNFKDDEEYQKYLKSKRDPGLPRLIKDRLEELNMSQVEFAKMIGISHGALSSYIHLRATPSDNYLLRIYEGCGRHLD